MDTAITRRLREELSMTAELGFLFKFEYQTQYDALGAEHELCWVYAGWSAEWPCANPDEIAAWRYVPPQDLQAEMIYAPERFTPWFKLEWERVMRAHSWALGANLLRTLPDNSRNIDALDQSGRR